MVLLLLSAATFALPKPNQENLGFSSDDFPFEYMSEADVRGVGIRLTVTPEGHLQQCQVEFTSGVKKVDDYTCKLAMKQVRFEPARWSDQSAAYGVYRERVMWSMNSSAPLADSDIDIAVDHLPKGIKSPAIVELQFTADANGKPVECALKDKEKDTGLTAVACNELIKQYVAIPPKDQSGTPVRSVQNAEVAIAALKKH